MIIDVYADIVCPWCYIGERRLEKAMFQRADLEIERRWHPFQLDPTLPREGMSWRELVEAKFGGPERSRIIHERVTSVGLQEGIHFNFDEIVQRPNTVDGHRLIMYARERDLEWQMVSALFYAYFSAEYNLSDLDQLAVVASGVLGQEQAEVRAFLDTNELVSEVRQAAVAAHRMGIRGVPFYIVDGRFAFSGAQPVEFILQAIEAAETGALPEGM